MSYYFISNSSDEKIVGKKIPQCKGIPSSMGLNSKWFDKPNSMTKLTNEHFPDFEPELIFELEEKSNLTDVISPSNISAMGFLINQKTKDVFDKFNLMEHKYYTATLIVKGIPTIYYWLHFKENSDYFLSNIDYDKSTFHICDLAYSKISDIEINSYSDYLDKKRNLQMRYISCSKLFLKDEILKMEYDLFYIGHMFLHCFASFKLVEAITKYNISGLEIKEQQILL